MTCAPGGADAAGALTVIVPLVPEMAPVVTVTAVAPTALNMSAVELTPFVNAAQVDGAAARVAT